MISQADDLRLIAAVAGLLLVSGCTRADHAREVLEAQGFKNVKVTGYRFFGCSTGKDDSEPMHTGFEATGPTGKKVSGVVCEGVLFKNATVRYD